MRLSMTSHSKSCNSLETHVLTLHIYLCLLEQKSLHKTDSTAWTDPCPDTHRSMCCCMFSICKTCTQRCRRHTVLCIFITTYIYSQRGEVCIYQINYDWLNLTPVFAIFQPLCRTTKWAMTTAKRCECVTISPQSSGKTEKIKIMKKSTVCDSNQNLYL